MLRKLAVLLVLGTVLLTACGGDDAPSAEAGPGGDTGAVAETGAVGGAAAETGQVGAIDAAECAELAQAMAAASAAAAPGAGFAGDLEATLAQLETLADLVPEEISEDMRTVAEAYAVLVEAYSESGYDPTSGEPPTAEQIAALTAAAEQLNAPEFQEAADRVSAYFEAGCQV